MTPTDHSADLLSFIDAAPTPYHAVVETRKRLENAGFRELDESTSWSIAAGDKVYVVRGETSLLAFIVGTQAPSEAGLRLVGAHTDSPNLRIKPKSGVQRAGVSQLAVEPYGGVLFHTWLDRDLSLAGRVFVRDGTRLASRLVHFSEPLARIASLAIHLNRGVNTDGLVLNAQTHLPPLLALESGGNFELRERLGEALGAAPEAIVSYDLSLYDVQPGARSGARGEFLNVGRLDNLASSHAGLVALLGSKSSSPITRGIALYDHEECGSRSAQGADSVFLRTTIERLVHAFDGKHDAFARAISKSFLVSADMAHAVHPNYADKHEPGHWPLLGAGPVIKTNMNQSYATDGESAARFDAYCRAAGVTPQHFVTRSDLGCGSTIGPITASQLGIRTVDVGSPMLSMHSIREMCAASDVTSMIAVLTAMFDE
jgi:aspartyl aminopeptidase